MVTEADLFSDEYEAFMQGDWSKRHTVAAQARWGVWRWLGMYEHRDILQSLKGNIIDFGGAKGPLYFGSNIVDADLYDINGGLVYDRSLDTLVKGSCDVLFSSHTIEHLAALAPFFAEVKRILKPAGRMILHLPSDQNMGWHPAKKEGHKRLFSLHNHADPAIVKIDDYLDNHGWWEIECGYCGDSSIFWYGWKGA